MQHPLQTTSPSDPAHFVHAKEVAKTLALSEALPPHFRNKPAEVFFALQTAFDLGISPLMAMQNLYMVHGRMGMSASLAIALCNKNGPFLTQLRWETDKSDPDNLSVTCVGVLDVEDPTEARVEVAVDMNQARLEGWASKNQKYKTMPEQMLRYRSATWLIRLYAPEVLLGFQSNDELVDTYGEGSQPGLSSRAAELNRFTEPDTADTQNPAPRVIEVENTAPEPDTEGDNLADEMDAMEARQEAAEERLNDDRYESEDISPKRTKTSEEVEAYVKKAHDDDEKKRQAEKAAEAPTEDVDPAEIHGELFD